MSFGPAHTISLTTARELARQAREKLLMGIDPLDERRQVRAEAARRFTFKEAADAYIKMHAPEWSAKTEREWQLSLETHAASILSMDVREITTPDVFKILDPLCDKSRDTYQPLIGQRVKQRLGRIMNWVVSRGYRPDNPADGKRLSDALPKVKATDNHHGSIPWSEMPAFMAKLRATPGNGVKLLELIALTGVRASEAALSTFDQFDLAKREWCIPAAQMKMKRTHRVPLSPAAMAIIEEAASRQSRDSHVFLGRTGKPIKSAALLDLMTRLYPGATVHGLRSSLRTWAAEATSYPSEVCEAALAHENKNKVESAYARTDYFDQRRGLMNDWARFLDGTTEKGKVVSIKRAS